MWSIKKEKAKQKFSVIHFFQAIQMEKRKKNVEILDKVMEFNLK